jgi:hypothetical protein
MNGLGCFGPKYHSLVDNGTISRFGAVDDTEEEILQEQILNATKQTY